MICTVTFNPSLDYIVRVDDMRLGAINRTVYEQILPGGKGINVSVVLGNLGHKSRALGFLAGFTGNEIARRVAQAGVDADLFVICDEVIEPICDLKTSTLHAKNPRLHSDETLLALSVSSATDPIAKQLVDAADQLRGCDAFFSVILSPTDEKLYRTLGINICCEPKYEQRRYFHK